MSLSWNLRSYTLLVEAYCALHMAFHSNHIDTIHHPLMPELTLRRASCNIGYLFAAFYQIRLNRIFIFHTILSATHDLHSEHICIEMLGFLIVWANHGYMMDFVKFHIYIVLFCKNNKYFQSPQDKVQYGILIYNILYFYWTFLWVRSVGQHSHKVWVRRKK